MNRKVVDYLVSTAGLVIAVVLLAVGGLMVWGHVYIDHQVHNQLAVAEDLLPAQGQPGDRRRAVRRDAASTPASSSPPAPRPRPTPTTSSPCTSVRSAGGKTYAQVSSAALADPTERDPQDPGRHAVPGHDPARPAAQRLRLRHDGHDRRHRRHRALRRSADPAGPLRAGLRPCAARRRRRRGDRDGHRRARGQGRLTQARQIHSQGGRRVGAARPFLMAWRPDALHPALPLCACLSFALACLPSLPVPGLAVPSIPGSPRLAARRP